VSSSMRARLPEPQRADVEDYLWSKSGGVCFLCGGTLNRASDTIEADHDLPDAEGGPTDRDNLNLVHASCNQSKRNSPSMDVRPYLRLATFMRRHGGMLKYGDVLPHFEITPGLVVVTIERNTARLSYRIAPSSSRRFSASTREVVSSRMSSLNYREPRSTTTTSANRETSSCLICGRSTPIFIAIHSMSRLAAD
jgi:hypothetical protein